MDRVRNLVNRLRREHSPGADLFELVRLLVEEKHDGEVYTWGGDLVRSFERLLPALRQDGYDVSNRRLMATTAEPTPLVEQQSLLEGELERRQLTVALTHYRQAIRSHAAGHLEASNGQLRSFLESLFIDLAEEAVAQRPRDPKGAIDRLRNAAKLDGDEAALFKGLIGISNQRGAHSGLTDEDEALFRLHFSTAAARWLIAAVQNR
jgi:hypothetical protein